MALPRVGACVRLVLPSIDGISERCPGPRVQCRVRLAPVRPAVAAVTIAEVMTGSKGEPHDAARRFQLQWLPSPGRPHAPVPWLMMTAAATPTAAARTTAPT